MHQNFLGLAQMSSAQLFYSSKLTLGYLHCKYDIQATFTIQICGDFERIQCSKDSTKIVNRIVKESLQKTEVRYQNVDSNNSN